GTPIFTPTSKLAGDPDFAWEWLTLLGCVLRSRSRSGLARIGPCDFAAEAFDAARGVDQLLLAGKERVAGSADFDDEVALVRGAGVELVATGALNVNSVVLRVNCFFWH